MSTVTKPIALDETLQSTNTALGSLGKDTTLQAIATAIANVGLSNIGNMSSLATTDKTSLVSAINEVVGDVSDLDTDKADKVTSATNGNLAGLNASGNLTDSGWASDKTTTSASGNPISITGLKSNQLAVNPVITFEPIQEGSGDPSPSNVRAISGYDKIEVLSCGKNIFPLTVDDIKKANNGTWTGNSITINNITFTILTNDNGDVVGIKANGNSAASANARLMLCTSLSFPFTVIMNGCPSDGGNSSYALNVAGLGSDIGSGFTISDVNNKRDYSIYVFSGYKPTDLIFYPMIRSSEISDTTYEPYHKTTDLSESLGQTVYGGTLDVRTGVLTVDEVYLNLKGLTASAYMEAGVYFKNVLDRVVFRLNGICSHAHIRTTEPTFESGEIQLGATDASVYWSDILTVMGKTITEFNTWLASEDVVICYKTPNVITIQLTPHEISLLKDYAYVSTNGTSIALDYHNGELASLGDVAELSQVVENSNQYTKEKYGFKSGFFGVATTANTRKVINSVSDIVDGELPDTPFNCCFSAISFSDAVPTNLVIVVDGYKISIYSDKTNTRMRVRWIQSPY